MKKIGIALLLLIPGFSYTMEAPDPERDKIVAAYEKLLAQDGISNEQKALYFIINVLDQDYNTKIATLKKIAASLQGHERRGAQIPGGNPYKNILLTLQNIFSMPLSPDQLLSIVNALKADIDRYYSNYLTGTYNKYLRQGERPGEGV